MFDIVLIGIQGSGKGTQGKLLSEKFGYSIFNTGQVLREMAASGTPLGEKIKGIMERGDLLPDEIVVEILQSFVSTQDKSTSVIFDGIPRTVGQMKSLDMMLRERGREYRVVVIDIPEDEVWERLRKRATIEGRADDSEEAIHERIVSFYKDTKPVIEKYGEQNQPAININGQGSVEEIFAEIVSQLGLQKEKDL